MYVCKPQLPREQVSKRLCGGAVQRRHAASAACTPHACTSTAPRRRAPIFDPQGSQVTCACPANGLGSHDSLGHSLRTPESFVQLSRKSLQENRTVKQYEELKRHKWLCEREYATSDRTKPGYAIDTEKTCALASNDTRMLAKS